MFQSPRQLQLYKVIVILGCIAFGVVLIAYAYIGTFMRYSGDDYCYAGVVTERGFLGAQVYSYFHDMPYHGNRYSLTFVSGLSSLLGPKFSGFLPGLGILLWIIGLVYLLRGVSKVTQLELWNGESVLIAEVLVFTSLFAAPSIGQSFYWRSGMLPHIPVFIGLSFILGFIIREVFRERSSPIILLVIFLLSFLNGGFSETGAAFQAGVLMLAIIAAWVGYHRGSEKAGRALRLLVVALIGTVVAIILLLISPAIRPELAEREFLSDTFESLRITLWFAIDFMRASFRGLWLPHLVELLFFAALGCLHSYIFMDMKSLSFRRFLVLCAVIIGAGYFLTVYCVAPSSFTRAQYPSPRALLLARYVMVLMMGLLGWFFGVQASLYSQRTPKLSYLIFGASVIVLMVFWLYPLRAAIQTYDEAPRYRRWTERWEARDDAIMRAVSQGIRDLEVTEIDHIVPWVAELSEDPDFWYNRCAAEYYGLDSIRATLLGWDE
ncbi:MAG: hypothetical protein GTO18_05815 [Anaerolineales bacterium]|nr:hypothetical protein [Anaerolineales bacterium]